MYLPVLACRFIAQGGTFKSCSLHVLSENITWKTSIKLLLPHLAFLAVMSFLFARMWCSWVCPLGAMQDAMSWLRRQLGAGPWHLAQGWDRFFRVLRHVLLWLSLAISALITLPLFGGTGVNDALFLIYCQLCPSRLVYPPLGASTPAGPTSPTGSRQPSPSSGGSAWVCSPCASWCRGSGVASALSALCSRISTAAGW